MKPPIKDVPIEVNRRLDELDRKTLRQTIIKTVQTVIPQGGGGGAEPPEEPIPEPGAPMPPIPQDLDLAAEAFFIRAKITPVDLDECPDFVGLEWHASIASGFEPDDSTFRGSGPESRVMLHVPDCGIIWYVKVRSYDRNGYYSEFSTEKSIEVPPPSIPTIPGDPTEEGDLIITGGMTEINDCDTLSDWESEEADAIRLYAAEGGSVKEGTGALKIEIDKYGRKIDTKGGSISASHWQICNTSDRKFVGQRIKSPVAFNVKRIMLYASKFGAPASPLEATLFSDAGGDPNIALKNATFNAPPAWPSFGWIVADIAVPVGVGAGTAYWVELNRVDKNIDAANYYMIKADNSNPYEGEDYGVGWGTTSALGNGRSATNDTWLRVFSDQTSLNKHFKVKAAVLGTKDLTDDEKIEFWVCGSKAGAGWLHASMGEAALGEQTHNITVPVFYQTESWDISSIANTSKDGIQYFGFKIVANDDQTITLYLDFIRSYEDKALKCKFPGEVVQIYPAIITPKWGPHWQNEHIVWDSGWFVPSARAQNREQFDHNLGYEPDMWILWSLCESPFDGGPIMGINWDFQGGDRLYKIVYGLNKTDCVRAHGYSNLVYYHSSGGADAYGYPRYRLIAIKKTPDYNSGWLACPALGTQTTKAHGIGSTPHIYMLELGHNTIGSGVSMVGVLNHSGNRPTVPVDVNAVNIIFSTGDAQLAQFYDFTNTFQSVVAVANWYYRLKAWDWEPDYTSPWTLIDTSWNNHIITLDHGLGKIPFLYFLEFSKANDGSDDIVPMMGNCGYNADPYGYGCALLWMDDRYASVVGNMTGTAVYEDSGGVFQNLVTGYVRLKLWI